jgi:hypothetical protein
MVTGRAPARLFERKTEAPWVGSDTLGWSTGEIGTGGIGGGDVADAAEAPPKSSAIVAATAFTLAL